MPFTMPAKFGSVLIREQSEHKEFLIFYYRVNAIPFFLKKKKKGPAGHLINNEKLILKFWAGEMAQWVKVHDQNL